MNLFSDRKHRFQEDTFLTFPLCFKWSCVTELMVFFLQENNFLDFDFAVKLYITLELIDTCIRYSLVPGNSNDKYLLWVIGL